MTTTFVFSSSFAVNFFLVLSFITTSQSLSHIQSFTASVRNGSHRQKYCLTNQATNLGATSTPQEGGSRPRRSPSTRREPKSPQNRNQYQRRHRKSNSPRNSSTYSPNENRLLNQKIVQCPNAQELLAFLASTKGALTGIGGGGVMNSVNFSTALHRIARHTQYQHRNSDDDDDGNNRARALADPRFALLACGAAEALVGGDSIRDTANRLIKFGSREMSNIAWAIAKLKIAPPQTAMPVDISNNDSKDRDVMKRLKAKSEELRSTVYQVAKDRAKFGTVAQNSPWIPSLSELCGLIMDGISYRVTQMDTSLFQLQEFSNLLWAFATAQRTDDKTFNHIISSLISGMTQNFDTTKFDKECLRPQEWSNSIWALATSGIAGPEEQLLPFVADLMDSHPDFVNAFKPQELSNTAWGVATILSKGSGEAAGPACDAGLRIMRHAARQLIERQGEGYKTQELTNSVWAFATLGFGLGDNGVSETNISTEYTFLISDDEDGDRELMEESMQVAIGVAKQILHRFRSQEINNLAWTMARLEQGDQELLEQMGKELCNPRRPLSSQDIGTSLWSFATLEYFDENIYRKIASRVKKERAGYSKPQELTNVLWALATADIITGFTDVFDTSLLAQRERPSLAEVERDPVMRCCVITAQELIRRPHDFKPQEIKDTLWAFSRLRIRHPALFKSVAEHLVGSSDDPHMTGRGLDGFSAQGLGNLAWSYARQAQLGADVISRDDVETIVPSSSGRLSHYITSYIDIGESLLRKLFKTIAETDLEVHDDMSRLKPQDVSNTAWAFAILGMKHDQFLSAVMDQLQTRMERYLSGHRRDSMVRFKGQELANALWALATLNYSSGCSDLMNLVEAYLMDMARMKDGQITLGSIARVLNRQEMANLCWACAVFGEYPPDMIQLLYKGLLGVGEQPDPSYVRKIHQDGGIQSSAIMSILYLQIAMDLEQERQSTPSLPGGFPELWDGDSSKTSGDNMMENFALRLTRSKIQQSVSNACERIGFSHMEEHVIGMDTLSMDHGIQMVPNIPKEVLSIDIANVDSQIGIEVDGPAHFVTNINDGGYGLRSGTKLIKGKLEYQFDWDSEHQEVNGPTALKARILEELGWCVHNLPFWEWYDLESDGQKEEKYCRSLLEN